MSFFNGQKVEHLRKIKIEIVQKLVIRLTALPFQNKQNCDISSLSSSKCYIAFEGKVVIFFQFFVSPEKFIFWT